MSDFKFDPNGTSESELSIYRNSLSDIAKECHKNAIDHGFDVSIKNNQLVALMSEFGEWCEAVRKGDIDNEQEEVVDMLVRIFAYAVEHFPDTWHACLLQKMKYNEGRPFRHGKKF